MMTTRSWLLRMPGIRHMRYAILKFRYFLWWESGGCLLGAFPNPRDMEYLLSVWRGE
jgi:hypothetical protein